jgi:hypothetical protein
MPALAVALYRQAVAIAINNKVDPVLTDANLCPRAVAALDNLFRHQSLKMVGIVPEDLLNGPPVACTLVGLPEVGKQPPPHVLGMELHGVDRVDQPHLVACSAGGHVEALLISSPIEYGGPARVWGLDQREEHDVALVSLEVVCVASDECSMLELLGRYTPADAVEDSPRLVLAEE